MKRIGKWLVRIISLAAIVTLVVAFMPAISNFVSWLLPSNASTSSILLKSKMLEMGKLVTVEYTDSYQLNSHVSAIFFDAQVVSFPYDYQIKLGIDLEKVEVVPKSNQLLLRVPNVEVISDQIIQTGETQKWDLFYPFTDKAYEKLLREETEKRRNDYLNDNEKMHAIWQTSVDKLKQLLSSWLNQSQLFPLKFDIVIEPLDM